MQPAPLLKSFPTQMNTVQQTINDSLLYDWVIRVEYLGADDDYGNKWQQWKNPLFALKSPQAVLEAITACHTAHPYASIRLNAEKLRPRTSVIYWVLHARKPASSEKANIVRLHTKSPHLPRPEYDGVKLVSG